MKRLEFDLDAPTANREARARFRDQSRSVTALYERHVAGIQQARGWKVLVECVPEVTRPDVRDLLGALTVQFSFDIEKLQGMDKRRKQRAMLQAIHAGALLVARHEGWPEAPLEIARENLLELELVNAWFWTKPKWNPGRQFRGRLWCVHDMDAFRAWLVVEDKSGAEQTRRQIVETSPSEFEFAPLLGTIKWSEPNRLVLLAKDSSEVGALVLS